MTKSAGGTGYEISKTQSECAATGRELAAGEPVVALLVEHADRGFERLDIRSDAWDPESPLEVDGVVIGRWKSVARGAKKSGIEPGTLEELFDQALEEGDGAREILRYLLCLLLLRKRRLVALDSRKDAIVVRRVGQRSEEEPVEVAVPEMPAEQLDAASTQLLALLEGSEASEGS